MMTITKRILICDDDANILEMVSHVLTRVGYTVVTARGPKEFMARFCEAKPDLILLDVHMPDQDGFSIAQHLPTTERIPIIFITAHDRAAYRLCAPLVGAEDYLAKPFDTQVLLSRIEAALQTKQKTDSARLAFKP